MRTRRLLAATLVSFIALAAWVGCGAPEPEGDASDLEPPPSSGTRKPPSDGGASDDDDDDEEPEPELDASFFEDAGAPTTPDPVDQCLDQDDPGASEPTARGLPNIDDCDKSGAGFGGHPPITGLLNGKDDVDVYKFTGSDTYGCLVNPIVVSPTAGLEMCIFVSCAKGSTNFDGCNGGAQRTSDIGNPGCCVTSPGQTQIDYSCGGFTQSDDTADVFIRVTQQADLCLPYQFAYHF